MPTVTNLMIGIGAEYKGKSAFNKAETATQKLTKNIKNLAGAIGIAFSTRAVVNFAKASVKASLEASAQQQRLAKLLTVTNDASAAQIAVLTKQADALQRIGVVSAGSITQVQSQLATFDLSISTIEKLTPAILDYVVAEKGAAASASEFKAMTNGLAQALNGNFASLTKTGFVLDEVTKKTIATGTESKRAAAIVKVLNSTYKGFNESLAKTPSGQMALLANASQDVKTIIGDGIVTALSNLNDGSIVKLTDSMRDFATETQYVIIGLGELANKLKGIPGFGNFQFDVTLIPVLGFYLGLIRDMGKEAVTSNKALKEMMNYPDPMSGTKLDIALKAKARAERASLKLEKQRLTLEKKKTAELKARAAIEKANRALDFAGTIFDLDKIQLYAALQGRITDEDRDRLNLKLLLLNAENQTGDALNKSAQEATLLSQKILMNNGLVMTYDGLIKNLITAKNPFEGFDAYTAAVLEQIRQIQLALDNLKMPAIVPFIGTPFGQAGGNTGPIAGTKPREVPSPIPFIGTPFGQAGGNMGATNQTIVNVNANWIANPQEVQDAVQNALQNANRAGNSTNYAGGIF